MKLEIVNSKLSTLPLLAVALSLACIVFGPAQVFAYYDPVGGRFLSPDPLGHEASMDLYSYANGDPINFMDPDGRFGKNAVSSWQTSITDSFIESAKRDRLAEINQEVQWGDSDWAPNYYVSTPERILSGALHALPGSSTILGAIESFTGQNALTGEPADRGGAALATVFSVLPMGGAGGGVGRGGVSALSRSAARMEMGTLARATEVVAKTPTQLEFGFVHQIRPVIFKGSAYKPSLLQPGEFKLHLPDLRNDILNWEQNLNELKRFTEKGISFREATPLESGGWLQRERNHLHYLLGYERVVTKDGVFWMPRR